MGNSQDSASNPGKTAPSRRIWILLVAALSGVAVAGVYFLTIGKGNGTQDASPFRPAPGFELSDSSNRPHHLDEWRGNVVILHFWASWCPPCLSEIPQWVELANEFKGRPLKLIAISEDERWQDAQKVLPSQGLPPSIVSLLDVGGKVSDRYGSFQFPETYLLNSRLQIVTKWVGPQEWKNPTLLKLLDELLKNAQAPVK